MTPLNVLAVVSEIFPLIKTGGLADVAGALPGALAAEDVAVRSVVPGYPAVLAGAGWRRGWSRGSMICSAARHALSLRRRRASICSSSMHRICSRATPIRIAARMGANGPTTRSASPRCHASPSLLAQGLVAGYRPDVVHAHDWQAGLVPAYLHYAGAINPPTVMTVHNLAFQGHFPADLLSRLGLPAAAYSDRWRRVLRRDRLPEGRAAFRRPDHHGFADLRGGDLHAGGRHGHGWSASRARRCAVRHPQRHRHDGVGSGARPASRRALRRRSADRACRQQGGAANVVRP